MKTKLIRYVALVLMIAVFSGCQIHRYGRSPYAPSEKHVGRKPNSDNRKLSDVLKINVSRSDDTSLFQAAAEWIGVPYKYGGSTKRGVDCSGLVVNIYQSVYGKKLYRNSAEIRSKNCRKISKSKLRTGDLVFFATGKSKKKVNHVGIYLKDGKFIHASTSKGVIVSDLNESYYRRTFVSAGKVR